MKQLLLLFLSVFVIAGCNVKAKEVVSVEHTIEAEKFIEKPVKLNITRDFVLGKFDYKKDSTFVKVNARYSNKEIYLKKQTYKSFLQMVDSAKADGIALKLISGTRNFYEQKAIWERKWKTYANLKPIDRAKKILEYSSMPTTSRHHWGTDLDLNSLNNSYFNSGKGLTEYNWLKANANHYGFYQVYTDKINGRTGYNLEKWHWSYLPLASKFLEYYNSNISNNDIIDFEGAELAEELNIIDNYVNGISREAKNYK